MNPIELGKAIAEVGMPIITAVMLILVVSLVWYLIKRQTKREDKHDKIQEEVRLYHRNLITNHLEHIDDVNLKNTELNVQGIALQKEMMEDFKDHNGHTERFSEKVVESLSLICDKLNGDSTKMKIAKTKLNKKEVNKIK